MKRIYFCLSLLLTTGITMAMNNNQLNNLRNQILQQIDVLEEQLEDTTISDEETELLDQEIERLKTMLYSFGNGKPCSSTPSTQRNN